MSLLLIALFLFVASTVVGLFGVGGGLFYLPILLFTNFPPHEAAALSNLGVFLASCCGALLYLKEKKVDPLLFLFVETPTAIGSFIGGYVCQFVGEHNLKLLLIGITGLVGLQMSLGIRFPRLRGRFCVHRRDYSFPADTLGVLSFVVGVLVGTAGVGGGIFKVPLMLAAEIPYPVAVGTSLSMITITTGSSLISRLISGGPHLFSRYPVVLLLPIGAVISSHYAKKLNFPDLRRFFGILLLISSVLLFLKR